MVEEQPKAALRPATSERRLRPNSSRCERNRHGQVLGHARHWRGLGSTSAIRLRIADGAGVEQPGGSFLHQRTHTPDPLLPVKVAESNGSFRLHIGRTLRPCPSVSSIAAKVRA